MTIYLWIVIIVAIVILWLIGSYNSLIRWRNRVKESWSDIEVQLKRRYDLIPNLLNSVKGYAAHEKDIFIKVTEARTKAMDAASPEEKSKAENGLTETLKTLFAVAENYPQLRASENFKALQDELTDTENKIQASRRFYNGNVRDFNTKQEIFPINMIVGLLGFKKAEFFQLEEETAKQTPEIKF